MKNKQTISGFILFVGGMGFVVNNDTRYTEVKAVIDDTASWKEINEKYELISQQGDIYTFKLRENDINE